MHIFVANFLGDAATKNYWNWIKFSQVFGKVKRVTFFLKQCSTVFVILPLFAKISSATWPWPCFTWGQHVRLLLAMINICTKFEVSSFTLAKDAKGAKMYQSGSFWGLGVSQRHLQCHHSIGCIRIAISHPLQPYRYLVPFWDIAIFLPKFEVVTWPWPRLTWGQYVIGWLVVTMVNKYTNFEVVSFTRAKDTKGAFVYQNRSFGG